MHGNTPEIESPLFQSLPSSVHFLKGSVTNREDWKEALFSQDVVVHLAAETGTGQSMYEIQRYLDVNVGGTGILLDLLANKAYSVKKIIIASSRAIYGEGKYCCSEHGIVYPLERLDMEMAAGDYNCKCPICRKNVELLPTTEDSLLHPSSVYGITKQTQEELVMTVGKSLGIGAVGFRFQNVYGPGQSLSNPYTGILSIFSTRIRNGKAINIFEDGKETRDFIYIEDAVEAIMLGLENDKASGNVYNVGTGIGTDVLTVAETLCRCYNRKVPIIISGNYRIGDIRHNIADISQIKHDLGFKPIWDFQQGIAAFANWVSKQAVYDDNYDRSIQEMREKGLYK